MTELAATTSRTKTVGAPSREWGRREVQVGLILVSIVLTTIAGLSVSLLFPAAGETGVFSYPALAADPSFAWVFFTLTGVNLVLAALPVALAAVLLVPGRGWRWVTAGFPVVLLGAASYAVGVGGWAMVSYFAVGSTALDPATAAKFVASINDDALHSLAPAATGAIVVVLGVLLLSVGLWRSHNVPRWVIVLAVVGSIITFVLPTSGIVGVAVETPQALSGVLIGWFAWRFVRSERAPLTETSSASRTREAIANAAGPNRAEE